MPTQEVADTAFAALPKPPPTIHTTPDPRTYVQIRTGLWVDPANTADQHATASVDGQTVTVTASQAQVVWNLGEGGTVTCLDAGTPGGTSCGYTYQRSSAHLSSAARPGVYDISARVTWHVSWICTGPRNPANGEMANRVESLPTMGTLAVGEVQTETRPG
ncbi:MAG TPA: hypothetical protein VGD71_04235 [Kribbella sp.]